MTDFVWIDKVNNVDDVNADDINAVAHEVERLEDDKVDKETGKGLSTNDFTDNDKDKLDGIENGAEVNVVTSVAGKTGAVTLAKGDVGLENVDNTSDMNKPVSTAQQTALDAKQDTLTFDDVPTENSNNPVKSGGVYTELDKKADKNGSYEDMSVGNAEQLKSIAFVRDKKPYNFRTSGGGADIGDRDYTDEIVGGTIVWNQIFLNSEITIAGLTITITENGSYRANGTIGTDANVTLNNITCNANRVYLFALNSENENILLSNTATAASIQKYLIKNTASFNPVIHIKAGTYSNADFVPQIFDLTLMFGADIADYLDTLENSSAGSGVAWFTKLFPKKRYDYTDGELLNVRTNKHITTGFNQWDEEWEVGAINTSTGENSTDANTIRSKNYIKVLPNTTYYFKGDLSGGIFFYDEDKSYIAGATQYVSNTTYITPNDAHYVRFTCGSTYGNTYKHDICINLSWDGTHNGEYQEYEVREYPLDNTLTLRGIPKLDVNNNLYYDGDTYEHEGTVTRKYGMVDLGDLGWSVDTTSIPIFKALMPNDAKVIVRAGYNTDISRGICKSYIWYHSVSGNTNYWTNITDKSMIYISGGLSSSNNLYIRDDNYQTAADFKAAVTGIILLYELAAPETETAEPFQYPQIVNDFGTEEFVDPSADVTGVAMPVGHNTKYTNNLRAKLDMAPNSPDDNGDYILRRTNGINSYARYVNPGGGDADDISYDNTASGLTATNVQDAVDEVVTNKENILNKVTSLSSSSTDTQYPSAKCVYDALSNIQPAGDITSAQISTLFSRSHGSFSERQYINTGITGAILNEYDAIAFCWVNSGNGTMSPRMYYVKDGENVYITPGGTDRASKFQFLERKGANFYCGSPIISGLYAYFWTMTVTQSTLSTGAIESSIYWVKIPSDATIIIDSVSDSFNYSGNFFIQGVTYNA